MKKGFISKRLRSGRKSAENPVESITETIQGKKFAWTNLQNPDRADVEALAEKLHFNALNVEDCMTKFELPKLDSYDDHFFVILHFPPLAQKSGISKNSQLSVFLGRDFLVTVHHGDLMPLVELANICRTGSDQQRRDRLLGGSAGLLLHEIIDVLVDDMLHTSRKIIANLDEMEELVFDEARPVARSIALLRREINRLGRIASPLKRFVNEIASNVKKFTEAEDELGLYYDDVIDHIDKVIETLDESRETMEIYKDTDFVLSTEKTNKVLGMLTIIFTLAIPATVIGTFYGMNVNLPVADDSGFLGPFTTFAIIILASAVPAAIMFAYFKKLGWISR
ncbi:MAG: magnesium transporter [Nitrosopumilus sp. H8]|nr:MAG: magnesium transporter [Nitrosopumilus sp. H13]RNJ78662.1 MAG: magnesium transporter [Nitrosopumilus sp. H8]